MPVLYETVQRGWATFGSPLILACYFATLLTTNSDSTEPPSIWIFIPTASALVLLTGAATEAYTSAIPASLRLSLQPILAICFIWHRMLLLLLDLCLFFILSQSLSKKRNSPMHVPSEMAYIPVILCMYFVLPRILGRVTSPSHDKPPYQNADADWVLSIILFFLFTFPSFVLVLVYMDDAPLSKDIHPTFQVVIFILIVLTYAFHTKNFTFQESDDNQFQSSRRLSLAISTIFKAAVLCIGIFLFRANISSSHNGSADTRVKVYDFYSLRSITQETTQAITNQTDLPLFSLNNLARIIYGIYIRSGYLLCGGKWFLDLRDASYHFIWNSQIDRRIHETDIHDLHLAFLVFTILVSLFGASVGINYNTPTPAHIIAPTHSVEILWSMLIASLVLWGVAGTAAFKSLRWSEDAVRESGKDE